MSSFMPHRRSASLFTATALAALTVLACRSRESQTTTDSLSKLDTTPAAATPAPDSTAAMNLVTDAQIAQIVMTANTGDSAGGALAKTKAKSGSVREFGQMMVRDHGDLNKKVAELGKKISLTPQESATSRQLQSGADSTSNALSALSGTDFDRAYIDHEAALHQMVLDQLDQTLIPGAQNADLKSLLQAARPTVAAHLERAKKLQTTLGTSASKP
jgi:putative membrane protein